MLSTLRVRHTIPQRLGWRTTFITKVKYTAKDASDQPLIHRLNVQVGKIVNVERHPEAEHLYVEQVDLGEVTEENTPATRTVVSGLVKYMGIDELLVSIHDLRNPIAV
jgi:tRNA-binding EMAP/Myf-like protein